MLYLKCICWNRGVKLSLTGGKNQVLTLQGCELLVGSRRGLWKAAQSIERPPSGTVTYRKWPAIILMIVWNGRIERRTAQFLYIRKCYLLHCCWSDPCLVLSEDPRGKCSPDSSAPISVRTRTSGPNHTGRPQSHRAGSPLDTQHTHNSR